MDPELAELELLEQLEAEEQAAGPAESETDPQPGAESAGGAE
jgi:hypothetical protein